MQELVTHQTGHYSSKPEVLHYERKQYWQEIVTLSPLPVIARHLWYSAEN